LSDQSAPLDTGGVEREERRDSVLAEISRQMVRLYKERFGRGPTKARADFAGPDVVICTLEDSLTPAERSLVELGEHQRLRDTRMYFQHASEKEFCGVIEGVLGRKVRAFVSGIDTATDVSSEIFYLEPRQADGDGVTAGLTEGR
jgi:uncharacterized protein YbcI